MLALAVPILNHHNLPVAGINIVLPRLTSANEIKKNTYSSLFRRGKTFPAPLAIIKEKGFSRMGKRQAFSVKWKTESVQVRPQRNLI
jgi:hypothetical protein